MSERKLVIANGAGTEFLRAELLSGMTRANIAQNTPHESKKQRNRVEARRAYEAILHFLPQTSLLPEDKIEIDSKLNDLKFALRVLGDEV